MVIQFLVTLVEPVGGREESHRIGNMNRHRHIEPPAGIPHGIETSVVYRHQFSGRDVLSEIQAQSLQDLQTLGSGPVRLFDCRGLETRIVRFLKTAVPRFGESIEAAWKRFVVPGDSIFQAFAITASEVHHGR